MNNETPEWLKVGAVVGVYGYESGHSMRTHARRVKVERFTKTLVILADGTRFNRGRLTGIAAIDDPQFLHYEARARKAEAVESADFAVWRWTRDRTPENAKAAADALLATIDPEGEPS